MFELGHEMHGGVLVLSPQGRLDAATSAAFENEAKNLVGGKATPVVLNLETLEYISSAGLRAVLTTAKHVKSLGGGFTLCGLQGSVATVMEVSGFDTMLGAHAGIGEAVAAIGS
jgi:anti-anti-sigma factor